MLLALVAFLVPIFAKVFKQFGGKLPALSQFTVDMSHLLTSGTGGCCSASSAASSSASGSAASRSGGGRYWDRFRLRIPFKIGDVVQKVALARWSRTLSSLTTAGVPILQAIEITGKTAGNAVVEEAMADVHRLGQERRLDLRCR